MTNNIKYVINSLTKEDVQLLIESLLNSCCINIYSNWYDDHTTKMKELAIRIRKMFPDIICENSFLFNEDEISNDIHTNEILKYFSELKNTEYDNLISDNDEENLNLIIN